MLGGISGIGKFLGLLADLVRRLLRSRKKSAAQESRDSIERDPAGEFIDRYGVRDDEQGSGTDAAETDSGERDGK